MPRMRRRDSLRLTPSLAPLTQPDREGHHPLLLIKLQKERHEIFKEQALREKERVKED